MAWLFLLVAGLCEIAWAVGLKYTEGFSRLLPTIGTVAAMAASIGFLFCSSDCRAEPITWSRG
jgi:quaternary ammonium compound-resistance protein SugE